MAEKSNGSQHSILSLLTSIDAIKDLNAKLVKGLLAASIAVIVLAIALAVCVYLVVEKKPIILGQTADGRVTPLVPLSEPMVTAARATSFVSEAIQTTFTIDFVNYRAQLSSPSLQRFYTPGAYNDLIAKITEKSDSGLLNTILSGRYVTGVALRGAPSVTGAGMLNGSYQWEYSVPFTLTFTGKNTTTSLDMVATILLSRISTAESIDGIAINRIALIEGKG